MIQTVPWEDGCALLKWAGEETTVVLPSSIDGVPLRYICANALDNAEIESLALPDTLAGMDEEAFSGCYGLKEVKLGRGLRTLDGALFMMLTLNGLELPETLETFTNPQEALFPVTAASGNPFFLDDGAGLYRREGNGSVLIHLFLSEEQREYRILPGCTRVLPGTISDSGVSSIAVPDSLLEIPEGELTNTVTHAGVVCLYSQDHPTLSSDASCLYQKTGQGDVLLRVLADVAICRVRDGTKRIGRLAFAGCRMEEIRLPGSVTFIHPEAFDFCTFSRLVFLGEDGKANSTSGEVFAPPKELLLPEERGLRKRILALLDGESGRFDFAALDHILAEEYMNPDRLRLLVWRLNAEDHPEALERRFRACFLQELPEIVKGKKIALFEEALALELLEGPQMEQVFATLDGMSAYSAAREMLVRLTRIRQKPEVSIEDTFSL